MIRKLSTLLVLICINIWVPYAHTAPIVRDAETEGVISDIAIPILKAAGMHQQGIKVRLILDETPNAFVVDGKYIFIHTGLLSFLPSPEALAGVIAHECGHITSHHFVLQSSQQRQLQQLSALGTVLGIMIGAAAGQPMAGLGAHIGIQETLLKNMLAHTRAHESAADEAAIRYMHHARLTLTGLIEFLRKLQQEERVFHSHGDSYWRTHPPTRERIEMLQHAQEKPQHHDGLLPQSLRHRYQMVIAKLDGYTKTEDQIRHQYSNNSRASQYANAVILYRHGHIAESLRLIQQLIQAEEHNPYFYELHGQILYENGRVQESISPYRRSIKLRPQDALLKTELAVALITYSQTITTNTSQSLREATELLYSALDIESNNAYAWLQLGIALSHQHDELGYYLALAKSHLSVGDMKGTRLAFKRAQALNTKGHFPSSRHQLWFEELHDALKLA